jgi:hypothetical protein
MVKPKNRVSQEENVVFSIVHAVFGNFFYKGDFFDHHPISPSIDVLNNIAATFMRPVFNNSLKYQPVCLGLLNKCLIKVS